jgi:flagellar biosynthesis protein FliR
MPDSIEPILAHLPAFVLVLSRMAGVFIFAPMLGSAAIPMRIKVLLAVAMSLSIYPLIAPQPAVAWTAAALLIAMAGELLIGLVIGFIAILPLIAMRMAGTLIGQQLGLDLAEIYHPGHGDRADVLAQFLFFTALVIFLLLDGHRALVGGLIGSFERLPVGGYVPGGSMLTVVVGMLGAMMELAVRVAAPVLCLVFVEAVTLGLVARTVPQLNILSAGFPLRIMLGVAMLVVAIAMMGHAFAGSMRQALDVVRMLGP